LPVINGEAPVVQLAALLHDVDRKQHGLQHTHGIKLSRDETCRVRCKRRANSQANSMHRRREGRGSSPHISQNCERLVSFHEFCARMRAMQIMAPDEAVAATCGTLPRSCAVEFTQIAVVIGRIRNKQKISLR
jgi:hypothetical protein